MRKLLLSLVALVFTTSLFAKDISVGYVLVGPSNDGGYWLIGFSASILKRCIVSTFINIKWSKDDVMQRTINNFYQDKVSVGYLVSKIDIDTISDIKRRG